MLIDGKFVSCYLVIFGGGMSKKREETGRKSFLPVGYFFVPVAHFFKRSEICSDVSIFFSNIQRWIIIPFCRCIIPLR